MAASDRIKQIFGEAFEKPPRERVGFLDTACKGDIQLRDEVDALLAAFDSADEFLVSKGDQSGAASLTAEAHPKDARLLEGSGTEIGRYKLLQEIGHGGFGTVFMAEQREPIVRKVALKVIKLGMDTRQVIARFQAERQALAMMDHPNIARVLDAGATDTGRPYFVMELVKGTPLNKYCDANRLPTRERLTLFTDVCHAVQHAHQKGVIHRDLKPSNVLVSRHDDKAVVKIIDFGIAKAIGGKLTEQTLFTEFAALIGTPVYMSPEQAGMSDLDIDTRSDIYSLGVLLYELLTGTTPCDERTLRRASHDEIRRMIREVEPPKPSTRVGTLSELRSSVREDLGDRSTARADARGSSIAAVAAARGTDPWSLKRLLRGDLDWIVMKCLEKDRTRRYETASELALDIIRFLSNEPVLAVPPSTGYRVHKWVRRHRRSATAAGLVATALVVAFIGVSIALGRARAEAEKTRAFNAFVRRMLTSLGPESIAQYDLAFIRDMLTGASTSAAAEFVSEPDLRADVELMVGETFRSLGLYPQAEISLRRAWEIRYAHLGPEDLATVAARAALAGVLVESMNLEAAEAAFRDVAAVRIRTLGEGHPLTLDALHGIAICMVESWDPERLDEAIRLNRQVLAGRRRLADRATQISQSLVTLGTALRLSGDLAGAAGALEEALAISFATSTGDNLHTATSLIALGRLEAERNHLDVAERLLREGLAVRRKLLGDRHAGVSFPALSLAGVLTSRGIFDEAEVLCEEAVSIRRERFGDAHPEVTEALYVLGDTIAARGDAPRARVIYEEVLERLTTALGRDHPSVAECQVRLATLSEFGP